MRVPSISGMKGPCLAVIGVVMALVAIAGNSSLSFAQQGGIDLGGQVTYHIYGTPLQQFKSGIAAKDVKCNDGFQLVIKTEDKSPACLKPGAAYRLINHGWAREFIQSAMATGQSTCEGVQVPSGDPQAYVFPVLVMRPDSVAKVCVTYNFLSDWQSYPLKDVYPHGILETCCFVHMARYGDPREPNKFDIVGNPLLFNVTGVAKGSKVSVTYTIYAKPDSEGFYDTSVPFDGCLSYPLAVKYNQSGMDASKFHADFEIPCFNTIDDVSSVKIVSGMNYTMVNFH